MVNRSATFVFNIDERFFGTLIAYVPGPQAADYDFTSGLPVQLLKVLAPKLMPLIIGGAGCASGRADESADHLQRHQAMAQARPVRLASVPASVQSWP